MLLIVKVLRVPSCLLMIIDYLHIVSIRSLLKILLQTQSNSPQSLKNRFSQFFIMFYFLMAIHTSKDHLFLIRQFFNAVVVSPVFSMTPSQIMLMATATQTYLTPPNT